MKPLLFITIITSGVASPILSWHHARQEPGFITLEEHWVSPAISSVNNTNPVLAYTRSRSSDFLPKLQDLSTGRLTSMTEGDIGIQVVSVAVAPDALSNISIARASNDQLRATIAASPDPARFRAWAFLPMALPDEAALELERAVRDLGFVGALVDNHLDNGTFYDGAAYAGFWAKAQDLNVPIYIHPTVPSDGETSVFGINQGRFAPSGSNPADPDTYSYPLSTAASLATGAWGWHSDVGLHFLRLYAAGVLEAFPRLKIVLGHMGEDVPFMLERADGILSPPNVALGRAGLLEVYARNVWVTTSGFFSLNTMATVLRNTAVDRIMYSVDYPYSNNTQGKQFMENFRNSTLVSESEWVAIARGNAERLLRL